MAIRGEVVPRSSWPMRMLRTSDWKLVRYDHTNGLDKLYDLKNDPGELINLYKDPQHHEVRAHLQ